MPRACRWPQILPGEGVLLESGERIAAAVVISNADPIRTLAMLGEDADTGWRERIEAVPIRGCTVKLNVLLAELPNFMSRPGQNRAAPLRTDQCAADACRVAGGFCGGEARLSAGASVVRALLPERA